MVMGLSVARIHELSLSLSFMYVCFRPSFAAFPSSLWTRFPRSGRWHATRSSCCRSSWQAEPAGQIATSGSLTSHTLCKSSLSILSLTLFAPRAYIYIYIYDVYAYPCLLSFLSWPRWTTEEVRRGDAFHFMYNTSMKVKDANLIAPVIPLPGEDEDDYNDIPARNGLISIAESLDSAQEDVDDDDAGNDDDRSDDKAPQRKR